MTKIVASSCPVSARWTHMFSRAGKALEEDPEDISLVRWSSSHGKATQVHLADILP